MACISRSLLYLLLSCSLVLSGCASKEPKPEKAEEITTPDGSPVQKIQAMPNPYLVNEKTPPAEAVTTFNTALTAMRNNQWPVAQQKLEWMTQTYPELSGPWVNLGLIYKREEQFDKAEKAFEQAIQVNSLNNDAYVQFAIMQREQGKFEQAEQLYLQALQVWPHNVAALINLGILYDMYMGRFDDALQRFELAQQLVTSPNQQLDGWIIDIKRRQHQ